MLHPFLEMVQGKSLLRAPGSELQQLEREHKRRERQQKWDGKKKMDTGTSRVKTVLRYNIYPGPSSAYNLICEQTHAILEKPSIK